MNCAAGPHLWLVELAHQGAGSPHPRGSARPGRLVGRSNDRTKAQGVGRERVFGFQRGDFRFNPGILKLVEDTRHIAERIPQRGRGKCGISEIGCDLPKSMCGTFSIRHTVIGESGKLP